LEDDPCRLYVEPEQLSVGGRL
jgi:hypothetical protein